MKKEDVVPAKVDEWPESGKEKEGLDKLAILMRALSQGNLRPAKAAGLAVEYYRPFLREKFDDFPRRQLELEQLVSMACRYRSLRAFLDDLSLEPPASPVDVRPLDREDYLTLSTVHSAKGLEWGVIFIIWLVDGRFPPERSFLNMESLEEELRLLYVAATRAKDKLIMVYPGQGTMCNPEGWTGDYRRGLSSFIRALPQDVIEHRSFVLSSVSPEDAILGLRIFGESMDSSGADSAGLKPGDRVNHPAFGLGVVSRFLGEDKVEVIFRERGTKLLHLGYTILEKI
jgi:DNA helicase-2/ATP-dependent DNA helicase PcrA